jgi:hypothetical protein
MIESILKLKIFYIIYNMPIKRVTKKKTTVKRKPVRRITKKKTNMKRKPVRRITKKKPVKRIIKKKTTIRRKPVKRRQKGGGNDIFDLYGFYFRGSIVAYYTSRPKLAKHLKDEHLIFENGFSIVKVSDKDIVNDPEEEFIDSLDELLDSEEIEERGIDIIRDLPKVKKPLKKVFIVDEDDTEQIFLSIKEAKKDIKDRDMGGKLRIMNVNEMSF